MKKLIQTGLLSFAVLALTACGGETENEKKAAGKIDTKDVKGTIDLMGAEGDKLNYSYNGKDCKAYKVTIGENAEMIIFPNDVNFEDEKAKIEKKTESSFDDVEIISSTEDCVFFKETKKPFGGDGEAKTGYGFIRVVKKDDKMNYVLESNGENPLDPIWSKEDAEKLLEIAKTFVPKS